VKRAAQLRVPRARALELLQVQHAAGAAALLNDRKADDQACMTTPQRSSLLTKKLAMPCCLRCDAVDSNMIMPIC
jgi:hypothetical protein